MAKMAAAAATLASRFMDLRVRILLHVGRCVKPVRTPRLAPPMCACFDDRGDIPQVRLASLKLVAFFGKKTLEG